MGRTESLIWNRLRGEPWLVEQSNSNSKSFHESEMALFYECMQQYARKVLDTADIVRDAGEQSPRYQELPRLRVATRRPLALRVARSGSSARIGP